MTQPVDSPPIATLAKGDNIVPIPAPKRRKYLEENAAAAALHLLSEEVAELEAAIPENQVVGERYTAASMSHRSLEQIALYIRRLC